MTRSFSLIFLLILILLLSGNVVSLYVDWLWFSEIQQLPIFLITLFAQAKLGIFMGFLFSVVLLISLIWANRFRFAAKWHRTEKWLDLPLRTQIDPHLSKLITILALLLGFFVGLSASSQWENYLLFSNPSNFGLSDSVFGKDFGFYVFRIPFLSYLQAWGMNLLILVALLTMVIYFYHGGLGLTQKGLFIDPSPKKHLLLLAGLILIIKGAGFRLAAYDLLYTTRGIVTGAIYSDIHARIPVLNLLAVLSFLAGIVVMISGTRRGWKVPVTTVIILLTLSLLGNSLYPNLLHRFRVQPNEIVLERPYIVENIKATRFAFGLDHVEVKEFPAEDNLTAELLAENNATIRNVRLWDHRPLLSTYRQLQQIRSYYDFVDVDNDRYKINGEYRQVMLSPRELSYQNLPGGTNWINEHLTYTHGYGLALGPVNRITKEGLPEFMIQDIPPKSTVDINITRPELYYNELANDYVFVKTEALEFDYPIGNENQYTVYEGKGGVLVNSWFRKLLFAAHFGTIKILFSDDITSESKILYYRQIMERINRLAPFLTYDRDPYLVITKSGRLVWIADGYTTTDRIPYSQPLHNVGNYIRNSVKVVIDAYDGVMTLYINEPEDPIIQSYSRIFPGLFKGPEEIPSDIREHLRYPQDLFRIQSNLYSTYHMQDPQIFYNKEDLWDIPKKGDQDMEPYYTIMKLPHENKEEFILMIPYTPTRRDNMSAWLAARSDAPHYGKLIVFLFPKQKLIYGPRQIEARIDQDGYISQQITLWGQRGSEVIRGSLLVIPIENSLLYIEPLYLAAESGSLPELRRVIVAYGNRLSMRENLEAALLDIFGEGTRVSTDSKDGSETTKPISVIPSKVVPLALDHLDQANKLLREGNWAGYGRELKKMEELLRNLKEQKD